MQLHYLVHLDSFNSHGVLMKQVPALPPSEMGFQESGNVLEAAPSLGDRARRPRLCSLPSQRTRTQPVMSTQSPSPCKVSFLLDTSRAPCYLRFHGRRPTSGSRALFSGRSVGVWTGSPVPTAGPSGSASRPRQRDLAGARAITHVLSSLRRPRDTT